MSSLLQQGRELQEYGRTLSCHVTLYFIVSFYVIATVFKYQNPQHPHIWGCSLLA